MCIIAIKNKGIKVPSEETIRTIFNHNPHGAGFAYNDKNGRVVISKGYMNVTDYLHALDKLYKHINIDKTAILYHARITTSGGTVAGNCHPFPIKHKVSQLHKLHTVTDIAVAHNGIIDIASGRTYSDTMAYIKDELFYLNKAIPKWYNNSDICTMIEHRIDSKLAILNGQGQVTTIGQFETDTTTGMVYSNDSYKEYQIPKYVSVWDEWEACYEYKQDKVYCALPTKIHIASGVIPKSKIKAVPTTYMILDTEGFDYYSQDVDYFYAVDAENNLYELYYAEKNGYHIEWTGRAYAFSGPNEIELSNYFKQSFTTALELN